jgi:exportin-2 (importin alpha re-exporter)
LIAVDLTAVDRKGNAMEVNDANVTALVNYLRQTLSHDASIRRPAENYLKSIENTKHFPILLLHVVDQPAIELVIRVSGAVAFKNFVRRNWASEGASASDPEVRTADSQMNELDRTTVKQNVVGIMLRRELPIQRQLSDAVAIIGQHDFPKQWTYLLGQYFLVALATRHRP